MVPAADMIAHAAAESLPLHTGRGAHQLSALELAWSYDVVLTTFTRLSAEWGQAAASQKALRKAASELPLTDKERHLYTMGTECMSPSW